MNSRPDHPTRRPNWLRFSLKTLFVLMLVVSAYLAGRMPATHQLKQAEHELARLKLEREEAEKLAAQAQLQWNGMRIKVSARYQQGIDAGMMIDAMEHQQRYLPTTLPQPLK